MTDTLTHIKIYGHGAADVLKQHEIKAAFIEGALNIILDKDKNLVIVAEGDKLRFYLESKESPNFSTMFQ